jgi:hypothetical protein
MGASHHCPLIQSVTSAGCTTTLRTNPVASTKRWRLHWARRTRGWRTPTARPCGGRLDVERAAAFGADSQPGEAVGGGSARDGPARDPGAPADREAGGEAPGPRPGQVRGECAAHRPLETLKHPAHGRAMIGLVNWLRIVWLVDASYSRYLAPGRSGTSCAPAQHPARCRIACARLNRWEAQT